jgi:hypothetical protein
VAEVVVEEELFLVEVLEEFICSMATLQCFMVEEVKISIHLPLIME